MSWSDEVDRALANALKRKQDLEAELAEISEFIRLHTRFSGTKDETKDTLMPVSSGDIPGRSHLRGRILTGKRRGRPRGFVEVLANVISDIGMPMRRGDLVQEIERRNVAIPSVDKERYLGTILWRNHGRFINLEGHGYWLRGRPCPEVGYTPDPDAPLDPIDRAEIETESFEPVEASDTDELFK